MLATEQDFEDFEQEKLINDWLKKTHPGRKDLLESKFTTSTGKARGTLINSDLSLDAPISKDAPDARFEEIVSGFDGRSLEDGNPEYHFEEHFNSTVNGSLQALGFNGGEIDWLLKMWFRSKTLDEMLLATSMTDSE